MAPMVEYRLMDRMVELGEDRLSCTFRAAKAARYGGADREAEARLEHMRPAMARLDAAWSELQAAIEGALADRAGCR